jgi:hypothetical protein
MFKRIICNLKELPYRLSSFLFRPFPGIDTGSNFLIIAGIENLLWLALFIYALLLVVNQKLKRSHKLFALWIYSYLFTFSSAASLYEGNLGTAFRHKSSILWALVLGILVTHKEFTFFGKKTNLLRGLHSNEVKG